MDAQRATPGYRERCPISLVRAVLVAGAAAMVAIGTMGAATAAPSSRSTATGPDFTVSGNAGGLFPGGIVTLAIAVQNPQPFRLTVNTADVTVGDASLGCGATNLSAQGFAGSVIASPNATTTIPVELRLLDTAPDACQGATFPLTFRATGSLDAPAATPSGPFGTLALTGLGPAASLLALVGLVMLAVGLAVCDRARAPRRPTTF